MKRHLVFPLILVLLLLCGSSFSSSSFGASQPEDCSCSASDGSCTASASCGGRCIAHCLPMGDCDAECAGFYQFFGLETTLQLQNGTYPQLVAQLARISGKEIAYSPTRPDVLVNADYKKAVFWDVLEVLADRGKVQIAGRDFEKYRRLRSVMLSGSRFSTCIKNTPVTTYVNDLSGLTGLPLRITSGRPMTLINLKVQDVTLRELLDKVYEETGTRIEGID
ncbi:MAG TPA: hypothetical protein VFS77_09250 [Pyrinomonadaceae bacterium]|nr:hypothetical protein [Pyrinomonadaceae bacterium]